MMAIATSTRTILSLSLSLSLSSPPQQKRRNENSQGVPEKSTSIILCTDFDNPHPTPLPCFFFSGRAHLSEYETVGPKRAASANVPWAARRLRSHKIPSFVNERDRLKRWPPNPFTLVFIVGVVPKSVCLSVCLFPPGRNLCSTVFQPTKRSSGCR